MIKMVTTQKSSTGLSLWKVPIHLLRARCRRHHCLDTGTRSQLIHRLQRLKKSSTRVKRVTARSRVYRKKHSSSLKKKSVQGRKVFRYVKQIMKSTKAYQSYHSLSELRLAKGNAVASRVMKQAWKLAKS